MVLRVGYGSPFIGIVCPNADPASTVREHFSSPLLQFAEKDAGTTFTLVECPSETICLSIERTDN